ncbi:MAG TPA: polysaccharide biosynthesis/export family protein [Thermoanaerobaculia bacterium]|nr:polysaccharide biosynthesis/export family protein [Thermoanaerobaculia bacterium]
MRSWLRFCVSGGLALGLCGGAMAQAPATPGTIPPAAPAAPAAAAAPGISEYSVGPKDLLEIRVLEVPELNVERRVSDGGFLELPLIGQIPVSGLTATDVRDKVQSLLMAKYVNRADVSVTVKEFASKPVSIVGAVHKPGSLNISGRWYILQAISAAGGLTETAGKKIYVLRRSPNGLSDTLEIKTDDLLRNNTAQWNILLLPGDTVNIPARHTVRVFCLGEVKTPGALEFDSDDRISLLSVIAKAGGLTDRASNSIRIKRPENGKDTEIMVNYRRIVAGKDPDPVLRADDVLIVKESFF